MMRRALLCLVMPFGFVLSACDDGATQKQRARNAEARTAICKAVEDAVEIARQHQRLDLVQAFAGCRTSELYECRHKVELLLEIADNPVLFQRIGAYGDNCAQEYRFAKRHGLEAFRDHWALVDKVGNEPGPEDAKDQDQDREPRWR